MVEDNRLTNITSGDVFTVNGGSRTTSRAWEYHQTDYDIEDLKRRVGLLENKLRDAENMCTNLERIVMNLDAMVQEMKNSIGFRYIDIK